MALIAKFTEFFSCIMPNPISDLIIDKMKNELNRHI